MIGNPKIGRRELMAGAVGAAAFGLQASGADGAVQTFVYVGSYTKNPPGGGSSNLVGLSVFRLDSDSGAMTLVQQVPSANPSFVALDPTRNFLYVVNEIGDYEGQETGSAEAYAIDPQSGKIRFVATADLGVDQVQIFRLTEGRLARVSRASTAPGAGPRHVTFHPNGRILFVVNELNATVTAFAYDPADGQIEIQLQTIATEPPDYRGSQSAAEIAVHPTGRFLYASNRGHNSIVGYRIDPATGLLSVIGHSVPAQLRRRS
jgi:6-phosphogluconolactonase (cycloisomerase 2 family)